MDLKIPYTGADKTQAYEAAKKILPDTISKFGVKADLNCQDDQHVIAAKGSGFEAKIHFENEAVQVKLDLSFLLKPLRGKVLEVIEKQLKKVV